MPAVEVPQSVCRFGLARRDITPPVGIYHRMWGAAEHDRSEGVHRPLTATALVFQTPHGERQVVVALDHCLLWDQDMRIFLDRVCRDSSVARDELLVTFSHTHAAGLMDSSRADLPGGDLIGPYLEEVAGKAASAVREATEQTQEVSIAYLTGRCGLAAHRDFWDERNDCYVCGWNPDGSSDDTVLVGRVSDERGNTVCTIVNYACHPTTLAWENRLISPDFPGAMRELVEQSTGVPCVFLQGASGDLGPRDGFVGDPQVADRNGRTLGYAVLSVLESAPPARAGMPLTKVQYKGPVVSGATIGVWQHVALDADEIETKRVWNCRRQTVGLPYRDGLPTAEELARQLSGWQREESDARVRGDLPRAAEARAMAERAARQRTRFAVLPNGSAFPFPIALWRTGDAVWLAVEGEPYNLLQRSLRERFAGVPIVVIELANGSRVSYLPTADAYGKGIYQESIAVVEKGSLEHLIEEVARQIQELLALPEKGV